MALPSSPSSAAFDPSAIARFTFTGRSLSPDGTVSLRYALDALEFEELIRVPVPGLLDDGAMERADRLVSLLHWVAGVSYFKAALPSLVDCRETAPPPAAAALLDALYSDGLAELAYRGSLPVPHPRFPHGPEPVRLAATSGADPERILVPVGGGKDSAVAIEIARRSGAEVALFSIGRARPIERTAAVAALPHLVAERKIDPRLLELNRRGAINGHVPVTAIVSCVALLTAAVGGYDAVAMANERSASSPNLSWEGVEVNHQFSKSLRAEQLLRAAAQESGAGVGYFSILRAYSELAIARAFARLTPYHAAFTSCNAVFRLDPEARAGSWCRDCPKCRFVFLALAPFMEPAELSALFGADLLADQRQYEGFALLLASGGHKPFECVGEEQESLAAVRLLKDDPRWSGHAVVRRLADEVLPTRPAQEGDPHDALIAAGGDAVPVGLRAAVDEVLGA